MAEIHIKVTVGPNGTLTGIDPSPADAKLGDVLVWTFIGERGDHWIGIGGFRDKRTGKTKNPMKEPYYSIAPTAPPTKNGNVEDSLHAKGDYKYRIVSIAAQNIKALGSEMSAQCASPVRPEFVLRVMTGCDGDTELDPEIQIGP